MKLATHLINDAQINDTQINGQLRKIAFQVH